MDSNQSDLLLFSKIQAVESSLSNKERKIARYILDNPQALKNCTALQLAKESGTSSATVVRFCRSCGFSGLSELKLYFTREILTEKSQQESIEKTDSVSIVKQKIKTYHEAVLRNVVAASDDKSYEAAANALIQAKKVLVSGVGGSQMAASAIMDSFLSLHISCEYYSDPVTASYKANLLSREDVLFVIMYTGSYRTLVEDMKAAHSNGVTVILLCGIPGSPAEKYADIVLMSGVVPTDHKSTAISVRVAELIIIEVLFALMEQKNGERGLPRINVDSFLESHRLPGKWPLTK